MSRTPHAPARRAHPGLFTSSVLVGLACTALPSVAFAHGREPSVGQVAFDPIDRDHFVLRGTWALLTTHDDGASFTWTCAMGAGFDRLTEDPVVALTASGRVHLGTFDGLRRSSTEGCDYDDGAPPTWGTFAIDVERDPHDDRTLWVAMSPGDTANTLLRSSDEGDSYEVVHAFDLGLLLERVRVAPSDPDRLYVSGAVPRMDTEPRHAYVLHSTDGGDTFAEVEIPLLDGERNAHVLAIDPLDADRALVRMTRATTDETPERLLLTEDGGATFTTVLEIREIIGLAYAHDGGRVWAGSWYGGLYRSDDGGLTWSPIDPDLRVRCLAERAGASGGSELFVCVDELSNDYAVGRSTDGGDTIAPLWGFADVVNDTGCSSCSVVGGVCPSYWPDVLYDIATIGGVDGGPAPGPTDAGPALCGEAGAPFDAALAIDASVAGGGGGSCGCVVTSPRARSPRQGSGLVGLAAAALVLLTRRRRGAGRSTAMCVRARSVT